MFRSGCRWIAAAGFPIRKSPDLHLYTASRGLSQCPTSFIGVWRQGIHRVPLLTCSRDAEKSNFFSFLLVDALSIQLLRCCCGCPVGLPPGGAHIRQCHSAMSHLRNTARLTAGLSSHSQCAISCYSITEYYFPISPAFYEICSGGDEGIRTPGLCLAKAALSQLSYIPKRYEG